MSDVAYALMFVFVGLYFALHIVAISRERSTVRIDEQFEDVRCPEVRDTIENLDESGAA